MKYISIILVAIMVVNCQQPSNKANKLNSDHTTMDMDVKTMSDTAKQLLINISNNAWYQSQMAQVILNKASDTSLLNFAQHTNSQYTRVKDKAKIVSIPYKLNMPYFLTHNQNASIDSLRALDEHSMKNTFIRNCGQNNKIILQQCDSFESMVKEDSDMVRFVNFSKDVLNKNEDRLTRISK